MAVSLQLMLGRSNAVLGNGWEVLGVRWIQDLVGSM